MTEGQGSLVIGCLFSIISQLAIVTYHMMHGL